MAEVLLDGETLDEKPLTKGREEPLIGRRRVVSAGEVPMSPVVGSSQGRLVGRGGGMS